MAGDGGGFAGPYQLHLSVDPAGEAAREPPGKPRRRYRRLTDDLFIAHDGKLLSIAGGKLIMKSKDGTEHSYTLAANPQITYNNAVYKPEDLKARQADPSTGVIVRVTAKKDKPQVATRIEALNSYYGFMADERERQRVAPRQVF